MSDHSSSSDSSSDKVPIKLEGPTNYTTWCRYVKGALKIKNLVGHIASEPAIPDEKDKLDEWTRQDYRAQGVITLSVSSTMLVVLGDDDMTAKQMWDKLATYCRRQDMWQLVDLLRQLTNTRLLDTANVQQHLATMSDIRTQFVNIGKPIPDWIAASLLLLSVPTDDPRWEVFLSSHTAAATTAAASADQDKRPAGPTWDSVSAAIMTEASKQTQQQAERARKLATDSAVLAAYAARVKGSNQGEERPPRFCTYCKKSGHVEETCWALYPDQRREPRTRRVQFITVTADSSSGTALSCRSDPSSVGPSTATEIWYVDSGASCHVTGDRTWFSQLYDCVPCTVTTASRGALTCTQRGTVTVNTEQGCMTLRNVLFVPSLAVNLLSVHALFGGGYRVHFTPNGCTIRDGRKKLLAAVKVHESVYPVFVLRPSVTALSAVVSSSGGLNWTTMHARLGHLNPRAIQLMHDKQMALGVSIPTQGSPDDIKQCVGCTIGKAHRLPFPAQASHRATRPLELVHSDMCGPILVTKTLANGTELAVKWYVLTFVDDYSRLLYIALTNSKSSKTAMTWFIKYKVWAERYTGFKVKAVRSDGGGEYVNNELKTYLETIGIDRQQTVAHTPQQNGVAERINRTLMEAARAMLHGAGLPLTEPFWEYAVRAAVYIRNRSPTRALQNVTPYEAWRGDKPDLSHLRVFGCRAWMTLDKSKRTSTSKLAARAMPCIFVGYSTEAKAWLVWDPVGKARHVTRDARFDESVPGSTLLTGTAAVPTIINNNVNNSDGSASGEAAEPVNTDRSAIIDALVNSDTDSDSDSGDEDEAAAPVQPAAAAAIAESIEQQQQQQQVIQVAAPVSGQSASNVLPLVSNVSEQRVLPGPQASSADAVASVPAVTGSRNRKRSTKEERALRQLAPFNTPSRYWRVQTQGQEQPALFVFAAHVHAVVSEPRSYKDAIRSPDRVQWERAMQDELDSIKANNTYTLVPLPIGRQAIGCKWVYKVKRHADGSVDRYKARLVAKGYSQLYGIDFTETFAPVVRFSSLRAILALAAAEDYEVHQMDVKTAFLNGDLDEDIYMQQPDGYRAAGNQAHHVWKLHKSLYGLKQAGRAWNIKMDTALVELGFRSLYSDSCVYVKRDGSTVMYLLVYVDDLLLVTNDTAQLAATKAALSRRFDMKDMGEAHFILGVQIRRDRAKRQLYLSQAEYVRTILDRFRMEDCKPAASPMVTGVKLLKTDPQDTEASEDSLDVPYASAVGALMYAALATRPDIAYAVTALCQFMSAPAISHWNAAKRVFRYLQGTQRHELVYGWNGGNRQPLYGYTDSDWGNDANDRRSVTGWVFLLHDGAVSWQSCKQPTVALSSTEAEYMAAKEASREAVWWRAFLTELGMPPAAATTIHSDSQGAIALSKNPEHHKRTKHIDIQHHYIREQVAAGSVSLPHIGTDDMIADVLTKPLAAERHTRLAEEMGVRASTAQSHSSGSVGDSE